MLTMGTKGASAPIQQPLPWVSIWDYATSHPWHLDIHRGHKLPNPGKDGQPDSKWQCQIAGARRKIDGVTVYVDLFFFPLAHVCFFFFFPVSFL